MFAYEFPVFPGAKLPQDNGYVLLAAMTQRFPWLHGNSTIQIAPLRGTWTKEPGQMTRDFSMRCGSHRRK